MLVALLADSHDNLASVDAALALLAPRKPDVILHAGDICTPEVLQRIVAALGRNVHFVFGNNDYDKTGLRAAADALGITCHGTLLDLTLAGKRIAMTHGDDDRLRTRVIHAQEHDYLILGHSHLREDLRRSRTRVINPGALHRARPRTVALLNLADDALETLVVGAAAS